MRTKTPHRSNIDLKEIITEIKEYPEITKAYEKRIDNIKGASSCVIKVDSVELRDGYKKLSIVPMKENVSYKTENGAITYRTLTHKLVGNTLTFGLACSNKGKMELYRFVENENVDCNFVASVKLSNKIVDPMYAIVSEDRVHIIYNVPSPEALEATVSLRAPQIDEDGVSASGAPGIVCFNLKEKEQHKILVPFEPMVHYSCGLYYDEKAKEPKLIVANIYDTEASDEKPSFLGLITDVFADKTEAKATFPFGISSVSFIGTSEISQSPFDGDPDNGVYSIILKDSTEDGIYIFFLENE